METDNKDYELVYIDDLPEEPSYDPWDNEETRIKDLIDSHLEPFNEQERQIIRMRLGLNDEDPKSNEEIAKMFGIHPAKIRILISQLLRGSRKRSDHVRSERLKGWFKE